MCEELTADPHALEVHGLGCPEQVEDFRQQMTAQGAAVVQSDSVFIVAR